MVGYGREKQARSSYNLHVPLLGNRAVYEGTGAATCLIRSTRQQGVTVQVKKKDATMRQHATNIVENGRPALMDFKLLPR